MRSAKGFGQMESAINNTMEMLETMRTSINDLDGQLNMITQKLEKVERVSQK